MKRLLIFAAAVAAAGMLARRAWDARHLPLAVAGGDPDEPMEAFDADDGWAPIAPAGDDGVLGVLGAFDEHVVAAAEAALNRPMQDNAHVMAATLRDEHRLHLDHTRALVDRLGFEPAQDAAVADVEARCFARRAELSRLDDDDFETAWRFDVVQDHELMIDHLDRVLLPAAVDERVIEHLHTTRAHLAAHLAEARMLG